MKKTVKNSEQETLSLYRLASGKPGRKIGVAEFLEITKEHKPLKTRGPSYPLSDGYLYPGSSKEEIRVIKRLEAMGAFLKLRGQCIAIPYKFGGKQHTYYPDFIVLTKTGKVVVIEVKQITEMGTKVNQKKYEALAHYCSSRGFMYMMCDKFLRTRDRIIQEPIDGWVEKEIDNALREKRYFDGSDYDRIVEGKPFKEIRKIRDRIGRYVLCHKGKVKEVGNLTHEKKRFRIVKCKKKEA